MIMMGVCVCVCVARACVRACVRAYVRECKCVPLYINTHVDQHACIILSITIYMCLQYVRYKEPSSNQLSDERWTWMTNRSWQIDQELFISTGKADYKVIKFYKSVSLSVTVPASRPVTAVSVAWDGRKILALALHKKDFHWNWKTNPCITGWY